MTKPNNSLPLVTVYMPTYNRVALLQRAVESVLGQDYRNIELIVVDDNSTDGTHQYLAEMAEKDSRFRYFINEENSGACVSRNKAIFAANGEFITGLDDDDYFLSHHISTLVTSWNKRNNKSIAVYPNNYVNTNKGLTKAPSKTSKCTAKDLISANWIGNQLFTKTIHLQRIGGFDENMPVWQDLECWYRLLKYYNATANTANIYSYVIDLDHPHERISSKSANVVVAASNFFSTKHKLTTQEKQILQVRLKPYLGKQPSVISIALSLLNSPKKQNFRTSILLVASPVIKVLKRIKQL